MKRRKFPIGLAVLLVMAVFGIAAVRNYNPPTDDGHNHDHEVTGKVEAPDKEAVRSSVKNAVPHPESPQAMKAPDKNPVEPSILLPDMVEEKPVPNEAATSALWYKDEARKQGGN